MNLTVIGPGSRSCERKAEGCATGKRAVKTCAVGARYGMSYKILIGPSNGCSGLNRDA